MKFDRTKSLAVIGAGTMGNGITQALAEKGKFNVTMIDISDEQAMHGYSAIDKRLTRLVRKTIITPTERDQIISRITISASIDDAATAQLVIEAVTEKIDVKRKILERLGQVCSEDTIACSNTSTLPISQLAEFYGRPANFMGMHWMNPVQLMLVIEIIQGEKTSTGTWEFVRELATECGKDFAIASDKTGFIANTILFGLIKAALFAYANGNGNMENIAKMMLGLNQPMCPLALADIIGLDVCRDIFISLQNAHGDRGDYMDSFYEVPPILEELIAAGHIGPKGESKRGFYDYTGPSPVPINKIIK